VASRHHKYDIVRTLRLHARLACFHAGTNSIGRKLVEDKHVVPILSGQTDDEATLLRAESARIKVIRLDARKLARQFPGFAKSIRVAQARLDERLAACRKVEAAEPPSHGSVWSKIPAAFLLFFDGGVVYLVLCDTSGIDLARGLDDLPVSTGILLACFALLVVFINAQAGFLATSPVSPRRRLLGAAGLLVIAGTLAYLRAVSIPEGGIALGLLGALVTIVAGIVGGVLQRKVLPILKAYRAHRQKLGLANREVAEAEEKLAAAKNDAHKAESQKKAFAAEVAALERKPQERASQRADIDQIQEARLKAVRYYYALGQRFAGKGKKNREGDDE
jgi:hypothetical protein